jgi:hypothetical protein
VSGVQAADVIADLLARGHSVRFRASGHSMHPIIRNGDYLLVEPPARIECGDVVLTLSSRGLTAHRVVRVAEGKVITRGDNAPGDDEEGHVLGVVTHIERRGRLSRLRRWSRFGLSVARMMLRVRVRLLR